MSSSVRSTPERGAHRARVRATVGAICTALVLAIAGCSSGDGSVTDTGATAGAPTTGSLATSFTTPAASFTVSQTTMADAPGSAGTSTPELNEPGMSDSRSYSADRQQLCQARDDLRTSVSGLTDPTVLSQGASAIGTAVDGVQTNLNSLATAAQPELKPQLDATQDAVRQLRTSAGSVGSGNIAQNLQNLAGDVAAVSAAAAEVFRALDAACGP